MAKLCLMLFAGIVIGAAAVPGLRAQPAAHPAYIVAETNVTDPAGFTEYVKRLPATLAPYHAKTLVRALPDVREGAPANGQIAILAFDSLRDANRWYDSPEYSKLKSLRQQAAAARVYIVDGLAQ